jgi:hypothetical protein
VKASRVLEVYPAFIEIYFGVTASYFGAMEFKESIYIQRGEGLTLRS